jgi:hypothetical protein
MSFITLFSLNFLSNVTKRLLKLPVIRFLACLAFPSVIMLPGFMGCSTYHEHHKDWIGVFMFDSVTAGAVLLEYDETSPKGNTFGNGGQYNVNVGLFRYDFVKQALTQDRSLFKDMKDADMYRVTEYNPPYLLQGAQTEDGTALFNLKTGEKKVLGIRVNHLSQNSGFFTDKVAIVNSEKMDTILYLPNYSDPSIYLYSELFKKYISLKTENSTGVWVPHILLRPINGGSEIELFGLPSLYYSDDLYINWEENIAPFPSIYPDSASVGCNIDSLLNGKVACDTFPRTSVSLNRLTGSFKTHHFIGFRDDGLYECSGKDTCKARQISNGGWSEN